MTEYVISGGCGFIGSNFIHHLVTEEPSADITNIDALTYAGNPENLRSIEDLPNYTFIHGSITDTELVSDVISSSTDVIVNFAAESHVDRSLKDERPFIESNILGTQVLLQTARDYSVETFIQISTDEVYGSTPDGVSYDETAQLAPSSPYSASKASADLFAKACEESYDYPIIITRGTNNYGPYQYPEKFIPLCITNALENTPIPVYGDGTNVRDWLFVEDHCEGLIQLIQHGQPGSVYNIGGNCEKQNIEIVRTILDLLDQPEELIEFVKDRPGHDQRYSLDCSKIREEVGWEPEHSFESGIDRTIKWYSNHREWWEPIKSGEFKEYYENQYRSVSS